MPDIKGVAHFSIPVSDVDRSTKFYTEIVGCKFLNQHQGPGHHLPRRRRRLPAADQAPGPDRQRAP